MSNLKAVILAAGKGTRMKSELPKVLHKIYDRCAIDYVCDACENAGISKISIIVGHKKEQVIEHVEKRNKNHQILYSRTTTWNRPCSNASKRQHC